VPVLLTLIFSFWLSRFVGFQHSEGLEGPSFVHSQVFVESKGTRCFRNGCCIIMSCAFHMVILFSQLTWEDDCACDSAF